MTTHIEQEAQDAADDAYPEMLLSPENEQLAEAFERGYVAGATRPESPVTDAEVEAAAHRYWLESECDADGDYPDYEWDEDARERFMWAARIVLEAARATREERQ